MTCMADRVVPLSSKRQMMFSWINPVICCHLCLNTVIDTEKHFSVQLYVSFFMFLGVTEKLYLYSVRWVFEICLLYLFMGCGKIREIM